MPLPPHITRERELSLTNYGDAAMLQKLRRGEQQLRRDIRMPQRYEVGEREWLCYRENCLGGIKFNGRSYKATGFL